jgi:hypothetical protein
MRVSALLFPLATAVFVASAAWAASGSAADVEAAVDLTRGAPAELAADGLIRLASLDSLPAERKVQILEQAFQLASASPQPYKRRSAFGHARGPAGFADRAYGLDLDALSLKLRAVDGLLGLDRRRARQRFEDIAPIQVPAVGCDDFLVYDLTRFYQVLGRVAASAFTPAEVAKEEPVKFLARYVGTISSPVQVGPVAHLLTTAPLDDAQFQNLATAFSGALTRISGDDRTFTFASAKAGEEIRALAAVSEQHRMSAAALLDSYRIFLVHHLTAARCEDSNIADASAADPVAYFNDRLRAGAIAAIGETEAAPAKLQGKASGLTFCDSSECKAMRDQYTALVNKEGGGTVQEADRGQNEWQFRVRNFLSSMAAWTQSSGTTATGFFLEKIQTYEDVLAIVPAGETREYVLRSMVEFLMTSRLPSEDSFEWYLPIIQLVGRIALDPGAFGSTAADLRRVNDPAIALEMALDLLAPRPVSEFMLLL